MGSVLLGLLVLLGFWSATRIQRATHAVLLVLFTAVALQVSYMLGTLCGKLAISPFRFYPSYQSEWLMELPASFRLRPRLGSKTPSWKSWSAGWCWVKTEVRHL
jgi:hypothetical protein